MIRANIIEGIPASKSKDSEIAASIYIILSIRYAVRGPIIFLIIAAGNTSRMEEILGIDNAIPSEIIINGEVALPANEQVFNKTG